jgi:hypothetical protein
MIFAFEELKGIDIFGAVQHIWLILQPKKLTF